MPRRSAPPRRGTPHNRYGPRILPALRLSVEAEAGEEAPGGHDDATAQRKLIYDLRFAIDKARAMPRPTERALGEVALIVYRNQHGIHAKYVLNGLSKVRVTFLTTHKLVDFSAHELEWLMKEDLL